MGTKTLFKKIILTLVIALGLFIVGFFILNPFAFYGFKMIVLNKLDRSCDGVEENNIRNPKYPNNSSMGSVYAKGNSSIYLRIAGGEGYPECEKIKEADYETFKVIDMELAKDKNHVYHSGNMLPDADPATYEVIGTDSYQYGKDHKHVYYDSRLIDKADPESIEIIEGCFAKDKNYVFQCGNIIPDANPQTFQPPKY